MDHRRREEFPVIFYERLCMSKLSIFIDESGDFGETRDIHDYYLITFVFHDQDKEISADIIKLDEKIRSLNLNVEYIHTGPIIRKEGIFENYSLDERRNLLFKIFNFTMRLPIQYYTVAIKRKDSPDRVQLSGKLGKAINHMLNEHYDYISSFDKVIVYYDNGQRELGSLLNAIFSIQLSSVEFKKADPREYRLSQVADFLCSIELLNIKRNEARLSKGEKQFFYKPNELKKTFVKGIEKKRLSLR